MDRLIELCLSNDIVFNKDDDYNRLLGKWIIYCQKINLVSNEVINIDFSLKTEINFDESDICPDISTIIGKSNSVVNELTLKTIKAPYPLVVKVFIAYPETLFNKADDFSKLDINSNTRNKILFVDNYFVEIIISAFIVKYYDRCINGLFTLGTFKCKNTLNVIAEKIDISFYKMLQNKIINIDNFDSIFFQICFLLELFKQDKLVHYDLHFDNITAIKLDKCYYWKGQCVPDASTFHYSLNGKDYYIPNKEYLIKFIDYDITAKYSDPQIINLSNYIQGSSFKSFGIRPHYQPSYDFIYIVITLLIFVNELIIDPILGKYIKDKLQPIALEFTGLNLVTFNLYISEKYDKKYPRGPVLIGSNKYFDYLSLSIFEKFKQKPIGTILTVTS